jgi:hypothetical protein
MKSPTAKQEGRHPLNWASSSFAAHANRSTHKPARETPRGFQLVYRNGRGDGGTDSAMRTSVRRPTATVPSRCRGACDASPAVAECHEFVNPVGFPPHRSRGRQPRNLADAVAVHVHPAVAEPHRPAPALLASRSDSRRSGAARAAHHARRTSDDACSRAWLDRWIRTRLVASVHRADGATVHHRPRPINLVEASEPVQQREVNQIPHASLLPIA